MSVDHGSRAAEQTGLEGGSTTRCLHTVQVSLAPAFCRIMVCISTRQPFEKELPMEWVTMVPGSPLVAAAASILRRGMVEINVSHRFSISSGDSRQSLVVGQSDNIAQRRIRGYLLAIESTKHRQY